MKILVTGGAGFVGSRLVSKLLLEDHDITVLDNLSTGSLSLTPSSNAALSFVNASILDVGVVESAVGNADVVFHLAAAVGVRNIMNSPLTGLTTNVLGSAVVLKACSKHKVPIILTSSSEIYGKNDSESLNEFSDRIVGVPQISRWSYSDSKATEEAFAFAYHFEKGLDIRIARLFNTVGPGQRSEFGMVLPRFAQAAIQGQDIEVYGDGNQSRCFMHVDDAVNGLIALMHSSSSDSLVYNFGNPDEITILELANKVKQAANSSSSIVMKSYDSIFGSKFEDMSRRFPDISRATRELLWVPEVSLTQIIKEVVEFERNCPKAK